MKLTIEVPDNLAKRLNNYLKEHPEETPLSVVQEALEIKLIPKVEAANSYASDVPAHYDSQKETFFIKRENTISLFPKNKKSFLTVFMFDIIQAFIDCNSVDPSFK